MSDQHIDQTEEDIVTGVDVVDGVLVFRRHDGTTLRMLGGGSRLLVEDFAFDTPNLDTGVPLITIPEGDWLMDCGIVIDTGWNGTDPKADIYHDLAVNGLYLAAFGTRTSVADADYDYASSPMLLSGGNGGEGLPLSIAQLAQAIDNTNSGLTYRIVPARAVVEVTLHIVVSNGGAPDGGPTGATQGAGKLWALVATPEPNS